MSTKTGPRPGQAQVQTPKKKATTAETAAVQEAKRQARTERQMIAAAQAAKRRRNLMIRNVAIVLAVVVVLGGAITAYAINEANKPGQSVPQQQSTHIATQDTVHAAYTTDPPTSGPHVPEVPNWGVYDHQFAKELQVHALEDAGVVINYQPTLDKAVVSRLADLARTYPKEVLMTPYEGLSDPIVLTAWTRIDRLQAFDEARIKRFIDAFRGIDHHKDSGS